MDSTTGYLGCGFMVDGGRWTVDRGRWITHNPPIHILAPLCLSVHRPPSTVHRPLSTVHHSLDTACLPAYRIEDWFSGVNGRVDPSRLPHRLGTSHHADDSGPPRSLLRWP